MVKKICDQCSTPSYSSSDDGPWICPVCLADLTHLPSQDAVGDLDQIVIKETIGEK